MRSRKIFLAAVLLGASPALWGLEDLKSDAPVAGPTDELIQKIRSELDAVRLTEKDIKLAPGWELPLSLRTVEAFFAKPLDAPVTAAAWMDSLEKSLKFSDFSDLAQAVLAPPAFAATEKPAPIPIDFPPAFPSSLKSPVQKLTAAVLEAQPLLDQAVDSVTPEIRDGFLRLNDWPDADTGMIKQEISSRRIKRFYDGMNDFEQEKLIEAGDILFRALDEALPLFNGETKTKGRIAIKTTAGTVLIAGKEDDVYEKKDLDGVVLLIDLGGKNTYKTPVAAAHEKEIRIVLDYGTDVTVKAERDLHGNAGAGVFGIGIFSLPNAQGTKSFSTGPYSQGAGVAGIGALFIKGTAYLSADRYVQGTGIAGLGMLIADKADKSTYDAMRSGQGAGFSRGLGMFRHRGGNAVIRGGLTQPDPREPLGTVSLCQGVGFGTRAYSGGAVGLAVVAGDNNTVRGSYFSQGVGYWHSLGAFRLRGDQNTIQARRYDLGTGVHSAFGHLGVFGNKNRILNWGVGPAYGWDRSLGSAVIRGNENEIQVEWGAAVAAIGSYSFSSLVGNKNRLKLCEISRAAFFQDQFSYAMHFIEGTDNVAQCIEGPSGVANFRRFKSPWGLVKAQGLTFEQDLKLTPPVWPDTPRQETLTREMLDLQAEITDAETQAPLEQAASLIDVAAAFSLDKETPRLALRALLNFSNADATALVDALEPAAVDQLIQMSVVLPAYGTPMANAIVSKLDGYSAQKKASLTNFLKLMPPSAAAPALLEIAEKSTDEKAKTMAVRSLGALLNKDTGEEPGVRAGLTKLSVYLAKPRDKKNKAAAVDLLRKLRLSESFGLLATAAGSTNDQRLEFIDAAPEDVTTSILEKGADTFLQILNQSRKQNMKRIENELSVLRDAEPRVRHQLAELVKSTTTGVQATAATAIGQIANGDDVPLLEDLLTNDSAAVREATAVALGRMGDAAVPALSRAMSGNSQTKRLALVAVTQTVSDKVSSIVEKGLKDEDPLVRLTAISVLDWLPAQLKERRGDWVNLALESKEDEENKDVQFALEQLH